LSSTTTARCESLRRSLSFNGYSVDLAQDGLEALDAIANDGPTPWSWT
jgi:DNA-binding response OmpR family regulator